MIMALVDDVLDLLLDCCNCETILIIVLTVVFAVCVELFSAPRVY